MFLCRLSLANRLRDGLGLLMTKPQMIRCPGSGQKVLGPDEPDGSVFCSVCGTNFLRMKKTMTADGKEELSVSEHTRRANPVRPKSSHTPPRNRRGVSGRDSRRR